MIYALVGSKVPVSDREAIARAINTLNAAVLAQYAGQGSIRHPIFFAAPIARGM